MNRDSAVESVLKRRAKRFRGDALDDSKFNVQPGFRNCFYREGQSGTLPVNKECPFKTFKPFNRSAPFKPPPFVLPRDAGEDSGGGLNGLNTSINYRIPDCLREFGHSTAESVFKVSSRWDAAVER
jgi:hypothetical protein